MEKMREEFEAWYWSIYEKSHSLTRNEVFSRNSFGDYELGVTRVGFAAYCQGAKRAALCVELPNWRDDGRGEAMYYESDIIKALDAAGIRYT